MDRLILDFFNLTFASPLLDSLMPTITTYGLFALPLFGAILFFTPERKLGATILLALLAGLVLTFTFYYLGLRPRPEGVRLLMPQPNFPSFPSGHTMAGFAAATILILFIRIHDRVGSYWRLITVGVALLAILIACSRLYLGHHYPSDVIAGATLGTAVGASTFGLIFFREEGILRWRWLLWIQVAVAILVTMMAYLNLLPSHLLQWPYSDKVLHFLLFGAIAFWLYLWMPKKGIRIGPWLVPLAILLPLAIAFLEELLQGLSSRRTASMIDLTFDLLGMICFYGLARWLLWRNSDALPTTIAHSIKE